MKKIKTLFKIDRQTNRAIDEINPGMNWVIEGKGVATLKVDGSSCMVKDGELYKRYDKKLKPYYSKQLRAGIKFEITEDCFNQLPPDTIPCEEKPDPVTLHHPHWVKVDKNKDEDKFHIEALKSVSANLPDGTYELIGEKINSNPYKMSGHSLVRHGSTILSVPDRSFGAMKLFLEGLDGEGVVFYNEETGDMCKVRKKDMCNDDSKVIFPEGQVRYKQNPDTRNKGFKPR